jgi:hypothetical protein
MNVNSSLVAMITELNQMNECVPFQFEFVDSNVNAGRLVPSHHDEKCILNGIYVCHYFR